MGTAVFIDNIEKQVSRIEKSIEDDSGIESIPDSKEIHDYIRQIIEEKTKTSRK